MEPAPEISLQEKAAIAAAVFRHSVYCRAVRLIERLKARGITLAMDGPAVVVKPKGSLADDERAALKAVKDLVPLALAGTPPELGPIKLEHAEETAATAGHRGGMILAPREWVEKHWSEIKTRDDWRRRWEMFPHGWALLTQPLMDLLDVVRRLEGKAQETAIVDFLKIAHGKDWKNIWAEYWRDFAPKGDV